jgi:hypothetical protein
MNKSAAFELGVIDGLTAVAMDKEAFIGGLFRKAVKKPPTKAISRFSGHAKEMGKAMATKTDKRGIVSKKVLDKATGKYRTLRHIEL